MTGESPKPVTNFGRNIRFTPEALFRPRSEVEVLRILDAHRDGTVRAVGARHSWNAGIESPDALVDLRHLRQIRLHADRAQVTVGAGCRIGELLAHLARYGLTLPSIGLIDRQTVAGAVATGTHGSGRHSMSHYVEALRIACYGPGGAAAVRTVDLDRSGNAGRRDSDFALRAARCSVGALGIVLEVTLGCVPQYYVREKCVWVGGLDEALEREAGAPLQQFYLIPHSWEYLVHDRQVAARNRRTGAAALYRVYRLLVIDVLLHLAIKLTASLFRSRRLVHLLYRRLLRAFIVPGWCVTDRSDRQLLMRHDLFRHMEMEFFVRRRHLAEAIEMTTEVLRAADDAQHGIHPGVRARIEELGKWRAFSKLRGTYVHHFPICVRRVLPDDTLISMSSCHGIEPEDWYAISLITYTEPRGPFEQVARLIATVLARGFGARLHWGKWFPPGWSDVEEMYPGLSPFRQVRDEFDPGGVFRNAFLKEHLSGADER
ncbi:MAG: FAD-binding protein [Gemmatimonadota bacterium]|nr:FAD-binding protein [Gemmatimonadota bacterium]